MAPGLLGRRSYATRVGSPLDRKAAPRCYGRATGPRESGTVAAFSFQSFDHGVTGRGTSMPSTRIASTCSLKNDKRLLICGHSGIASGWPHTISGYPGPPILADQ